MMMTTVLSNDGPHFSLSFLFLGMPPSVQLNDGSRPKEQVKKLLAINLIFIPIHSRPV